MIPRRPRRAAQSALALYEAVEPKQRFALMAGALLVRAGLTGLLPSNRHQGVDWPWWERWISDVAEPLVGRVGHVVFRVPATARVCALLTDEGGWPIGFGKILSTPSRPLADKAWRHLSASPLKRVNVPKLLAAGDLGGVAYRLIEPLPEGRHRRPPQDPVRVWNIVDEYRERLRELPRPEGVPSHQVPCHTEFTPRNLRVTADGSWWLFDWDNVRWGPKLADELRYWTAEFAYRSRPRVADVTSRVLELLRRRGTDAEIHEAATWPGHPPRTYRQIEQEIYAAVSRAVNR